MSTSIEYKKVTLPISKKIVTLKPWITGGEREMIENAQYEAIKVKKETLSSAKIQDVDIIGVMNAEKNRKIEIYVVSIDDVKENILKSILDMHEDDYMAVIDAIEDIRKKK